MTYHGFSAAAQAAFQSAVDVWSSDLSSPVPVTIDAVWAPMAGVDIADTTPTLLQLPGSPMWYPKALADRRAGRDLDGSHPDMTIVIDSSPPGGPGRWYLGVDGKPGGSQVDLPSAVLHEIAHGLGMVGLLGVAHPAGVIGPPAGLPGTPFDQFVATTSQQRLVELPSSSADLTTALTSGALQFVGPQATLANGGRPPRLYSPPSWEPGASIYHSDPANYPPGSSLSLMDPAMHTGEVFRTPGPLVEAMLDDLGWNSVPGPPGPVRVAPGPGSATLNWPAPALSGGQPVLGYEITATDAAGHRLVDATVSGNALTITQLSGQRLYIQVRARNAVGQGEASATVGSSAAPAPAAGRPVAPGPVLAVRPPPITPPTSITTVTELPQGPDTTVGPPAPCAAPAGAVEATARPVLALVPGPPLSSQNGGGGRGLAPWLLTGLVFTTAGVELIRLVGRRRVPA